MKKNTKKFLVGLLACVMLGTTALAFSSCVTNGDENNSSEDSIVAPIEYSNGLGFSKSKNDNSYCIADIEDKTITKVEIPQTYNGVSIERIEEGCFEGCSNLMEIFIPISVKAIGDDAFGNCDEDFNKKIKIYYEGTLDQWKNISIEDTEDVWIGNVNLYSEDSAIDQAGKYWHYDSNGEKQQYSMSYDFWRADFYSDRNSVGSYTHTLGEDARSFSDIFIKPNQGNYIHDIFDSMNASTAINERVDYFEFTNFLADGQPSEEARIKGRVDLYVCALLDLFGIQENSALEEYDLFKDEKTLAVGYDVLDNLRKSVGKDSLALMTKADVINANITDNIFKNLELFGNVMEQCTTVVEALQLYNRALEVRNYGGNLHNILIAISEENTAPQELRDAAKLLVGYIDKGFDEFLKSTSVSMLNTSFTLLTNYAMKLSFKVLCNSVPGFREINLIAKGFQAVNDVIGIDEQCAAYYKLRAASILEIVSMNIYNQTQNNYIEEYTKTNATQYMNAIEFFERAQYVGGIYYADFLNTLKENAFTDFLQGEDIDALVEYWLNIVKKHRENFNNFERICLNNYNAIICKNELDFSKDIEEKPMEDIPETALQYNGHYYYVYEVDDIETWEQAQEYCESKGGYLATITNQEENNAIYTYLKNQGIMNAYFGGTDKGLEGKWEWVTGEPFVYSNWGSGEPNDEGGAEDYIMFYDNYPNGEWNDGYAVDFSTASCFICEWGELDFTNASQGLEYTLSSDKTYYTVTGIGDCTDTEIIIPNTYKDLPVMKIADSAFWGCGIKTINIPENIENIGFYAFAACSNLVNITVDINNMNYISIDGHLYTKDGVMVAYAAGNTATTFTIPDGITRIWQSAFYGCDYLENLIIGTDVEEIDGFAIVWCKNIRSIAISAKVESIGDDLLYGCENLSNIIIDSANTCYETIDGVLYTKDRKTIVRYPSTLTATEYIIQSGVTHIVGGAFSDAVNLISIKLPDSIEYISESAFDGGNNIYDEEINGVYYLGNWAIGTNGSVDNIIVRDGTMGIAGGTFCCDNLVSVVIPSSVRFISNAAFLGESITSISFEDTDGWIVVNHYDPEDKIEIDVTNAEINVEHFNNYYWYNWLRGKE